MLVWRHPPQGRKETINWTFCGPTWSVWDPFLTSTSPPSERVYVDPFLVFFTAKGARTVWPEILHYRNHFCPGINFGITLHSLYRKYFSAAIIWGCGFFAYSWKLPAYSGAFLLTVGNFSFFAYSFSFLTYKWSFFAYSGKVRLIKALRDCKQRSLTVSKKAPTVSKKASLIILL